MKVEKQMEILRSESNSKAISLTGKITFREKKSLIRYTGKYTKYQSWKNKTKQNRLAKYLLWARIQVRLLSFHNRTRKVPSAPLFSKGHSLVPVKLFAPRGLACPSLLCILSQGTDPCRLHSQAPMSAGLLLGSNRRLHWMEKNSIPSLTASGGTSVLQRPLMTMVPTPSWWLWMMSSSNTVLFLSFPFLFHCPSSLGASVRCQWWSPCCC